MMELSVKEIGTFKKQESQSCLLPNTCKKFDSGCAPNLGCAFLKAEVRFSYIDMLCAPPSVHMNV